MKEQVGTARARAGGGINNRNFPFVVGVVGGALIFKRMMDEEILQMFYILDILNSNFW